MQCFIKSNNINSKETNQRNGRIIFSTIVLEHNSMSFHVWKIFLRFFACAGTQTWQIWRKHIAKNCHLFLNADSRKQKTNLCSTLCAMFYNFLYASSIHQILVCCRMILPVYSYWPEERVLETSIKTWNDKLNISLDNHYTFTIGVMNSSRKVCFSRDGQLWWKKLIRRPFMWDPSWSCL